MNKRLLAGALGLALVAPVSAHHSDGRGGGSGPEFYRYRGARLDNYGQQRRRLAFHQKRERDQLRRHQRFERRACRNSDFAGCDFLKRHQRAERKRLQRHQQRERAWLRSHRRLF
jgi:hypothetical protein